MGSLGQGGPCLRVGDPQGHQDWVAPVPPSPHPISSCAAQAVLPKDTSALVRLTLGRRPLGEAVAVPGPGPLLAAQALGPLSPEDRKDHARRVWHPGVSWLQEVGTCFVLVFWRSRMRGGGLLPTRPER